MRPRAPIGASARRSARREADARAKISTERDKHPSLWRRAGKVIIIIRRRIIIMIIIIIRMIILIIMMKFE